MGHTIIEKIIARHCGKQVQPGDIVDMFIDTRVARDFGGANVVKHLETHGLEIDDPQRTFFTFDCNPTGSDQNYATNQHICRVFARKHGIKVYDINAGIGTHIAIDDGLVSPGDTFVSTDSHANIVGAIGALGQGMGDLDIAYAFAKGRVWFKVPPTIKLILKGKPPANVTPKDITLFLVKHFGASGLLGYACEVYGDIVDELTLSARITMASMATEMSAIAMLFAPNKQLLEYCRSVAQRGFTPVYADEDAKYEDVITLDISRLEPLIAQPGRPDNVVPVAEVQGKKIDSVFIGSCTNGRYEDMVQVAKILEGRKVAPGVVLKIVPSTDKIWYRCLETGIFKIFKSAGALIGNAGCAGCAAGQIGQNGPGEVTVSTGNRNFPGKQGKGEVWLTSPATAAASAVAGYITTADKIPDKPAIFIVPKPKPIPQARREVGERPTRIRGRVWVIPIDNIDTDMIYHNRYLTVTDVNQMGQYAFSNLPGWQDFHKKVQPGDIIVTGRNFGCGSSRQHAVDCFRALRLGAIIAKSFAPIYERNAINSGLPIMVADLDSLNLKDGDELEIDFVTGEIRKVATGETVHGVPFSEIQLSIYKRGGLLP